MLSKGMNIKPLPKVKFVDDEKYVTEPIFIVKL
jgi:hypothetical protein